MLNKDVFVNPLWKIIVVTDSLTWNKIIYLMYSEIYLCVVAMDLQCKDL